MGIFVSSINSSCCDDRWNRARPSYPAVVRTQRWKRSIFSFSRIFQRCFLLVCVLLCFSLPAFPALHCRLFRARVLFVVLLQRVGVSGCTRCRLSERTNLIHFNIHRLCPGIATRGRRRVNTANLLPSDNEIHCCVVCLESVSLCWATLPMSGVELGRIIRYNQIIRLSSFIVWRLYFRYKIKHQHFQDQSISNR